MTHKTNEILCINKIFRRVENDYTNEALLYQNILEYHIKANKSSYKFSEMARWLIENNREFCDFYGWNLSVSPKTTKSYAVAKKKKRIQDKLDELIQLGLVKVAGKAKAEKVDTEVKLYENTNEGNLLALIINRLEKNHYAEIYDLMKKILGPDSDPVLKDSSSGDIFLLKFLKVCKEKNVIPAMTDFFVERMKSQKEIDMIDNSSKLLHELINLRWFRKGTNSPVLKRFDKFTYSDIWRETYRTLDDECKKLLLARYKSIFETPSKYPLSFKWELTRYDNSVNERKIVLLGTCSVCGNKHTTIQDTLEWLDNFFNVKLAVKGTCEYKKRECELNIMPFQE